VVERRELLDPTRYGFYSIQLLSHKVLRRLMGVPLIIMALLAPTLWRRGWIYRLAAVCQALVYSLGIIGLLIGRRNARATRVLAAPSFFIMANVAAMIAVWNVVRGRRVDRWEPARSRPGLVKSEVKHPAGADSERVDRGP
jgi:hypothetical protein